MEDVIDLLFRYNEMYLPLSPSGGRSWSDINKVVCVDMMHLGQGDVVGFGGRKLVIARQNENHFVPLIPRRGQGV